MMLAVVLATASTVEGGWWVGVGGWYPTYLCSSMFLVHSAVSGPANAAMTPPAMTRLMAMAFLEGFTSIAANL